MDNKAKSQEDLFLSHIEAEKISGSRTMCLLGSLLYLIFGIADFYSLTVTLDKVLIIRGAVIFCLFIFLTLSYTPFLKVMTKHYDLVLSVIFIIAAAGIEAMIYLAQPEDHASNVYFAGLLLVVMTIFSWSYFKIFTSISLTTLIIISYTYLEITKEMPLQSLFVNIVFLIAAASISFIAQVIRDRYIRDNFSLQQSLAEALKEKTEEADDNAYLANHDALTGLANRRFVTQQLETSLLIAKEKNKVLIIMFIDLNGFKQINDVYGHAIGDDVLKITARRLELAVRKSDCLSRLGGDEYLIGLLIDKENIPEVESMVEKYTAIISDPIKTDGVKLQVGASIGISAYPIHGNNIDALMDIADKKMYQVKRGHHRKEEEEQEVDDGVSPVVIFPGNRKTK